MVFPPGLPLLLGFGIILMGELLELAGEAAIAGQTILRVVGQQEFDDHLAGFTDPIGVGLDDHAFADRIGAGGDQPAGVLDLDNADPAGAGNSQAGTANRLK